MSNNINIQAASGRGRGVGSADAALLLFLLAQLDGRVERAAEERQRNADAVRERDRQVEDRHRTQDRQDLLHIRCTQAPISVKFISMGAKTALTRNAHTKRPDAPVRVEAHYVEEERKRAVEQ